MSSSEKMDEFSQRIVEGTYSTSELDVRRVLNVLKDSEKALDIAQRKGTGGRTALHNALLKGKGTSAIVSRLAGVYPEGLKVRCNLGYFPIHRAIEKDYTVGTIKSLLHLCPECEFQAMEKDGFHPVHSICRTTSRPDKEKIVIVEELLKSHPSCLSVRDKNGHLPIHLAAKHPGWQYFRNRRGRIGSRESSMLLGFLVKKLPASVRCKDARGNLPVHLWFRQNKGSKSLSLPKSLIDEYPESVSQKDQFGSFPVHLVAQKGSEKDFEYLVEKYPECLELQDAQGNYPIHSFLLNDEESHHFPQSRLEILQQVLNTQHSQNAQLKGSLEAKEQLVNTLKNVKESLEDEIKDTKVRLDCEQQIAEHARVFEKAFIAKLRESQADIPTLKSFASVLKARLDVRASTKQESSANKPSLLRRMFPSLVRDPEVSRSVLIDCVEAFDAELTVLETEEGDDDECSNARTSATEGNTQEQEHGAASELPHPQAEAPGEAVTIRAEEQEQRPMKLARVSLR